MAMSITVVGTVKTGAGSGKVATSLKSFIVVLFYAYGRLGLCTAQRIHSLPEALKMNRDQMIEHFCTAGIQSCASQPQLNCGPNQRSPNQLCPQICISDSCHDNCWIIPDSPSRCYANQDRICSYSNANVCQYSLGNDTSTCVYASSSPAFCICQYLPDTSYIGCNPSQFIGDPIRIHTVEETTQSVNVAQHTTVQSTTALATTAQVTTAQATTAQSTTAQATTSQATAAQGTTAQGTTAQTTTSQDATALATAEQEPKGTTAQDDNETNVAAIVLGSLFALLLLLVIIGVVMLGLRRQGSLPSIMNHTTKPSQQSRVNLGASLSINRRQLPEPPTPGDNVEYAYIPYLPTTNPRVENQAYASVHEEEGSSHDVMNGHENKETTGGVKNTYFGWIPTVEQNTENEASETAESQGVSSATGDVPREDVNISFQLNQHKVRNLTSDDGYEIPMVKLTAANQ